MEPFTFLAIAISLMVGLLAIAKTASQSTPKQHWPVMPREVMNATEQGFYLRLLEAYPAHIVLCQVPLLRLIAMRPGVQDTLEARNRLAGMTLDFVVLTPSFKMLVAIELDYPANRAIGRHGADDAKTQVLTRAGYRLLRYSANRLPTVLALREDSKPPVSAGQARLRLAAAAPSRASSAPIPVQSEPRGALDPVAFNPVRIHTTHLAHPPATLFDDSLDL